MELQDYVLSLQIALQLLQTAKKTGAWIEMVTLLSLAKHAYHLGYLALETFLVLFLQTVTQRPQIVNLDNVLLILLICYSVLHVLEILYGMEQTV